jgi:hypothetical protein
MTRTSDRPAPDQPPTPWAQVDRSRHGVVLHLAALLLIASPGSLDACSKGTFQPVQPEFFFISTALPDTVEAGWSGALGSRGEPISATDHAAGEGSRWAQLVRLEQVGGEAAKRLPAGTEHLLLVPWGYAGDCRTLPWRESAQFLEPSERGLMYATLRDPEHWVHGVPTADFHRPSSQPYPRHAHLVLEPRMSTEDAFLLHHVLPRQDDLADDPELALAPLLEWARRNPELARQEPAREMILRNLMSLTHTEVRALEVPMAGTWRFVLDLGEGAVRTFHARTGSAHTNPDLMEPADDWFRELRPPAYLGYIVWTETAPRRELLDTVRPRAPGGYLYLFPGDDPGDAPARRIPGAADLALATRALPEDPEVQALAAFLRDPRVARAYLDRNLGPGADASFLLHPDGAVTFEQRYHLPGRPGVVLRGVRFHAGDGPSGPGS